MNVQRIDIDALGRDAVTDLPLPNRGTGDVRPDTNDIDHKTAREELVYNGFGRIGYFCPNAYFWLLHHIRGTVYSQVLPLALLTAVVGVVANYYDWTCTDDAHRMIGFVVGFLLVIIVNFTHNNYEKAVTEINEMVQDGITICTEVLPSIGRNKEEEEESHSSVPAINGMSQFNAIDTDKSGEVSRSQWIEHYGNADLFDAYDADGNSFINAAEFMAGESSKGKFQAIDNNGDGVISRAEWMAKFGAATLFDLYDTDGDGEVSLDDFIQGQEQRKEQRKKERREFQRLIVLYFRLVCFEVRADIQARQNRFTWLDEDGSICTDQERNKFRIAVQRHTDNHEQEWDFSHFQTGENFLVGMLVPFNCWCVMKRGTFHITTRPALVAMWLMQKLDKYCEDGYIRSPPVHARMMATLSKYTDHICPMVQVDRTPLPFSYVHMAAFLIVSFCLTLPFCLVEHFGNWTPLVSGWLAMAYGGLYINGCNLRNPFNFECTRTGIPINVFVQRLERCTEVKRNVCPSHHGCSSPSPSRAAM